MRPLFPILALSALVLAGSASANAPPPPPAPPPAPPAPVPNPPATPPPAPAPTPPANPAPTAAAETLEGVSKAFADARAAKDDAKLLELTKSLLPTSEDLKKVLKAGEATDAFLEKYKADRIRGDANEAAREILKPKDPAQTVVKVHSATTEELAAYEKGSVAFNEFPGGLKRFAAQVAAPGRVWQTIEYLEPGKDAGMKYSVFTVLDGRVVFLLKPWRAVEEPK